MITMSSLTHRFKNAALPEMIWLPAGDFIMGESDNDKFANDTERPRHRVRIARGVALERHPVTVAQFRLYRPGHGANEEPTLPVVRVSWHEAIAYCDWLSATTGRNFRLPSEAEWECACRAGTRTPFATGHALSTIQANYSYSENGAFVGAGRRLAVGTHAANAYGFNDMHGNVCEWVADSWHDSYVGAPDDGSAWTTGSDSTERVIRGGAWDHLPRLLRSSWRDHLPPSAARDNVGFRVALQPSSID